MKQSMQNIFVIWDLSTSDVRINLQALARRPPEGFQVSFADPDKTGGDLLKDVLIPGIRGADRVLIIAPSDDLATAEIGFETGLAIGFGKTIAVAAFRRQFDITWLNPPVALRKPYEYNKSHGRRVFGAFEAPASGPHPG